MSANPLNIVTGNGGHRPHLQSTVEPIAAAPLGGANGRAAVVVGGLLLAGAFGAGVSGPSLPAGLARVVIFCGLLLLLVLAVKLTLTFRWYFRRLDFERDEHRRAVDYWRRMLDEVDHQRTTEQEGQAAWGGRRKFRVVRKVQEADEVCSLYLAPHDGQRPPEFKPGQYLTFQVTPPGHNRPATRCYSLSDQPGLDHYRITVKKLLRPPNRPEGPPGVISSYLVDTVTEGDILDVKAPAGQFFLDQKTDRPVVLIGGGVGMTPVVCMLNAIAASGSRREVWFFCGVRNSREHLMKAHLETLALTCDNLRLQVCYSDPAPDDQPKRDYHHACRVSIELLQRQLPSSNYGFYICGPAPMMRDLTAGLRQWGVPDGDIHYEAFGPATVRQVAPSEGDADIEVPVAFARSGRQVNWSPGAGTLLDLAEASGVAIDSGCRSGNCGACLVAVRSGEVDYLSMPGVPPEKGSCLTCIATPKGRVELDA